MIRVTAHTEAVARRTGSRRRNAAMYVALSLLPVCVLAPAAHAGSGGSAAPSELCTPGWVCGWTGPSYTGVVSLAAQDMPRYPETTAYVGFNDATSVWNAAESQHVSGKLRERCVTVYNGPDYKGRALTVAPGKGIPRLPASFGHVHSSRFHACRLPLP